MGYNKKEYKYMQLFEAQRGFNWSCGMAEQQLQLLKDNYIDSPKEIIELFRYSVSESKNKQCGGAAIMVSDNRDDTPLHKALDQVAVRVNLGKNTNSGNLIYCWIISRNSVKAYEDKNRKAASKKIAYKKLSSKKAKV